MIKLVVFDMAGTTVDEDQLVYRTVQKAINEAGYDASLELVLREGAGKAKLEAVKDVLEKMQIEVSEQEIENIHSQFVQMLDKAYEAAEIKEQPGASYTFQELHNRGIKVVLNTGYSRKTADQLLEKLGWKNNPLIDLTITSDEVERGRPFPDMIHKAMHAFDINDPKQVAKVGDAIIDIEEGRTVGCGLVLGITTGAHTKKQLHSAQPDGILDRLEELLELMSDK